MKCQYCKQDTAKISYENDFFKGISCEDGCYYHIYKPIKEILPLETTDFKIKGCQYRDIIEKIYGEKGCSIDCKINENSSCKSMYEGIINKLKTPIMLGYRLYHLKGENDNVFNFGSDENLLHPREFRPLRQVKLIIREECSGQGFIHDKYGAILNYMKNFEVITWKGTTKTGKKIIYFITDQILKKYFR